MDSMGQTRACTCFAENFLNRAKDYIKSFNRFFISSSNMNRLGIELGDVNVIIHAKNLNGMNKLLNVFF